MVLSDGVSGIYGQVFRLSRVRMRRQGQGFTLVELLVVIAIIALLASLLVPTLKSAQESARSAMCQSNLRQIAAATSFYVADNKGYLPPYVQSFTDPDGTTVIGPTGRRVRYTTYRRYLLLESWVKSGDYTDYPRSGGGFLAEYLGTSADKLDSRGRPRELGEHGVLGCPSIPPGFNKAEATHRGISYLQFSYRDTSLAVNYESFGLYDTIPLTEIERPAQLVFMADGRHHAPYIAYHTAGVYHFGREEDFTMLSPDPRHNGRYNALFVDGHVISTIWGENFTREHYVR